MQELLQDVCNHYSGSRIKLQGKARFIDSRDQNALLKEIPKRIEAHLSRRNVAHLYKVKGSIGKGNIARVPWVGIFRRDVTENAENGYYVVLLFTENMSSCYLSLNQGITAVEQLYTRNFALRKMRESAKVALRYLDCHPEALQGEIDLASTGDLGRAYEAAAISSFRYLRTELPSAELFFQHLDSLLGQYERLVRLFGKNLHALFTVSEGEFQQVAFEKATQSYDVKHLARLEAEPRILDLVSSTSKGYARSPIIAAEAIRAAQFACEIDAEHWTFTSKAKRQRYVEAHHLIPISQQARFEAPLDVVANIVSLCATCHRMLHYGDEKDRKSLLVSLLKQRKQRLREKSIDVKAADFLRFYASDMVLEE